MYSEAMEWLNYHHLLYFWTVAKEGSIARACKKLRLAQPTISGQLRLLEDALGEKLFMKQGRGLAMTEVGHVVFRYADEIFGLGRELQDVLKDRPRGRPLRLFAGVSDLIPKLVAYRVLRPRSRCRSFAMKARRSASWPNWPSTGWTSCCRTPRFPRRFP